MHSESLKFSSEETMALVRKKEEAEDRFTDSSQRAHNAVEPEVTFEELVRTVIETDECYCISCRLA